MLLRLCFGHCIIYGTLVIHSLEDNRFLVTITMPNCTNPEYHFLYGDLQRSATAHLPQDYGCFGSRNLQKNDFYYPEINRKQNFLLFSLVLFGIAAFVYSHDN